MISANVFKNLQKDLTALGRVLDIRPKLDLGLEPVKLVAKVDLLTDFDRARIATIVDLLKP